MQIFLFFNTLLKKILFTFRERGREEQGERNISVQEIHDGLPFVYPQMGTWPTTQACALTGNQISDLSIHRPVLNPLSHNSQGANVLSLLKLSYTNF